MADQPRSVKNNLKTANQAEILRSHQRDNDFVSDMSEKLTDLLHRYNFYKNYSHYINSDICAKLLYFIFTSGLGNQTLGEEYTGIVQANVKKRKIPSLIMRVFGAILECFGQQMLIKLFENLQKIINKPDSTLALTPNVRLYLNAVLTRLQAILPTLIMVHRGLFYIFGKYYTIGKRLTGIEYAKIYGLQPQSSLNWGLKMLGFVTITQSLIQAWQSSNVNQEIVNQDKELENNFNVQCQLCLEKIPNILTPCGHLYCWTCLTEWLRARNQCPICRETVFISRIVPLMNL